jgi:hypothetical protein
LNVSGLTTFQGASTHLSTLNIVGNIIGNGTALTNLNYNAITNPPTIINMNNPATFVSSLNVSGNTTLSNTTTCLSSLNVSGITSLSNTLHQGGSTFTSSLNISGITTIEQVANLKNNLLVSGSSVMYNTCTMLNSLAVSGTTVFQAASTHGSTIYCNGGVLYINGAPLTNPGSNAYTCLWNQSGVGATLSGYNVSFQTGLAPTTERMLIDYNGNININNSLSVAGTLTLKSDLWHQSNDGILRFYYATGGTIFFHSGNANGNGFTFRSAGQSDIVTINDGELLLVQGQLMQMAIVQFLQKIYLITKHHYGVLMYMVLEFKVEK